MDACVYAMMKSIYMMCHLFTATRQGIDKLLIVLLVFLSWLDLMSIS
jgi:hypothetical protein